MIDYSFYVSSLSSQSTVSLKDLFDDSFIREFHQRSSCLSAYLAAYEFISKYICMHRIVDIRQEEQWPIEEKGEKTCWRIEVNKRFESN